MRFVFLVPGLASLILTGCGESMMSVTPGGAQYMTHTRDLIENGWIPSTADYTTEGLFSEHSLPIDSAPCNQTLCPQAATAQIDPVDGTGSRLLVQVGFATNIAEDSFERPALNLAVAIDISGSMGGDKLETSKSALLEVIDQLDPNDQMTLITYGSRARVIHPLTVMDADGRSKMSTSVEGLESKGSTAMEAGLEKAIQKLAPVAGTPGVEDRIFLLTDAQPNVGATGVDSFVQIARDAADQQIGLTVWGVGLDLGAELVAEMSTIRGGNAYHFTDIESMQDRVRDEFDWMVTPIAYDVEITATPEAELAVDRAWGAPLDPSETRHPLYLLARRQQGQEL